MPHPTVAVTVKLFDQAGAPYVGVPVRAKLDINEVYLGFVIADEVESLSDATGSAVLQLFPNAPAPVGLGTQGSVYRFRATIPGGRRLDVTAQVPNNNCTLDAIADLNPAPAPDAAAAALAGAQAAAGAAGVSAGAAAANAAATAADRVQTGLDRVATSADRVQTGIDRATATQKAAEAAASAVLAALVVAAIPIDGGLPATNFVNPSIDGGTP